MKVVLRPDRLGGDAALPQVGSLGRGVHAEAHEPIMALSTTTGRTSQDHETWTPSIELHREEQPSARDSELGGSVSAPP